MKTKIYDLFENKEAFRSCQRIQVKLKVII